MNNEMDTPTTRGNDPTEMLDELQKPVYQRIIERLAEDLFEMTEKFKKNSVDGEKGKED